MPTKDYIQKEKEKAKNVAAKGSRNVSSLFSRATTALTPSSLDQLIEDEIKLLFIPIKTFSFVFLSSKPI